jgi:hypothetical protein
MRVGDWPWVRGHLGFNMLATRQVVKAVPARRSHAQYLPRPLTSTAPVVTAVVFVELVGRRHCKGARLQVALLPRRTRVQ